MARAQLGDRDSLDQLLAALQSPLYVHIFGIVRNRESAEDVLQDTLFTIARRLGSLTDPRWIRAWSYRIATRNAVKKSKRDGWESEFFRNTDIETLAVGEEQSSERSPSFEELKSRLDLLSPASALVLRMHYIEELTYPEISEALEVSIGTVKSRLAYGLAALRRLTLPP